MTSRGLTLWFLCCFLRASRRSEYLRKWKKENPQIINPEKRRQVCRKYYLTHKEQMLDYQRRYRRPRYNSDFEYRLLCNLRNRVKSALNGTSKAADTLELIGGSVVDFWKHVEKQLKPGWTKENYGTVWELDHKRPCVSFDFSDPVQQRECFHWSNVQPLSVSENRRKNKSWGNK